MLEASNRPYIVILALTVLFGGYLRFYNLGGPSFWVDELDFVEAAKSQMSVGEPLLASGYAYPRAPILTHALTLSFGMFGISEFTSRAPSAFFGLLAIVVVFWLGKEWFNVRTGTIAAILVTCSAFEIGWSRACRMYALFQLLFLIGIYVFYRGFEHHASRTNNQGGDQYTGFFSKWQLSPTLLLGGSFLIGLSYSSHQNAALFAPSFFFYLLLVLLLSQQGQLRNKYLAPVVGGSALAAVLFFVPQVADFLTYAFQYQPKWAEVSSAQNSWRILSFLFGWSHFPVNLLFVAGTILALRQRHKPGVYALVNLLVPVLLFSFVFQYRKNDYIYHVYPLLFLLAAFALDTAISRVQRSAKAVQERLRPVVIEHSAVAMLLALVWLPLTPGFRFAQKIPRLSDGQFNGALYHNEWRAARGFLAGKVASQDAIVSTLPLSVQYYAGRAEYNLNLSNSQLARQQNIVAPDGRFIDFYSGTDLIEDIGGLENVFARHTQGWIIVDNYRFNNDVYVPRALREMAKNNTTKVFETENLTVSIYKWSGQGVASAPN